MALVRQHQLAGQRQGWGPCSTGLYRWVDSHPLLLAGQEVQCGTHTTPPDDDASQHDAQHHDSSQALLPGAAPRRGHRPGSIAELTRCAPHVTSRSSSSISMRDSAAMHDASAVRKPISRPGARSRSNRGRELHRPACDAAGAHAGPAARASPYVHVAHMRGAPALCDRASTLSYARSHLHRTAVRATRSDPAVKGVAPPRQPYLTPMPTPTQNG